MVFICFAMYVLATNTRVVPYFESCMVAWLAAIHDDKNMVQTDENHVLFSGYYARIYCLLHLDK